MALKKTHSESNIPRTNYHRIIRSTSDFSGEKRLVVDVASYVNQSVRDTEKEDQLNLEPPVESRVTKVTQFSFEFGGESESLTRSDIYGLLKNLPEFSNAEDV